MAGAVVHPPSKTRAAALSIVSNTALIALKLVAGIVTGSIAIITEAVHSGIDLVASIVAYFSVRQAEKPADADHPYGHDKVENLAAAIEGMLILVGAGVIIWESVRRLNEGSELAHLGLGIAAVAVSAVVNLFVSQYLYRRAAATDSPALEGDAAHLRTDAVTSIGVVAGLAIVEATGVVELDAIVALGVAVAILIAGVRLIGRSSRVLVDEALPPDELESIAAVIDRHSGGEILGYHKLRARRAGSRRLIDMHVQFRSGTSLERAHDLAHELQREIAGLLRGSDVLIHLEPESSRREVSEG